MLDKPVSFNPPGIDLLVGKWQSDRDERARDKLVRAYMPSIVAAGKRLGSFWRVPVDDAIQECSIGFIRALETYDPQVAPLDAYLRVWAKAKVSRARGKESAITVPPSSIADFAKIARARKKLRREGRVETTAALAEEAGFGIRRTESALAGAHMAGRVASIHAPLGDTELTLEDVLPGEESQRPDVLVLGRREADAARRSIEKVLASFVPRHREVFRLRFVEELTMEETGVRLGIGRARVQQIEVKIVSRLRAALVDDPAALALLGREPPKAAESNDDDEPGDLIGIAEVEARTGLTRSAIAAKLEQGAFPRHVAANDRGNRLWSASAVGRWRSDTATDRNARVQRSISSVA